MLQQSWLGRKLTRLQRKRQERLWRNEELAHYGMTLHGEGINNGFVWR